MKAPGSLVVQVGYQEGRGGAIGERLGEVVALGDLAAHLSQLYELAGVLDALRDHLEFQSVGQAYDSRDDVAAPGLPRRCQA